METIRVFKYDCGYSFIAELYEQLQKEEMVLITYEDTHEVAIAIKPNSLTSKIIQNNQMQELTRSLKDVVDSK